ncbi:PH domain-containing protein [Heliorestis acidaminivorans]|uniref:PH domain-containing protein n=1 Tax=Heliorestis acidaminivorans TaxID=553427 RepID=UPI003C12C522
MRTFQSGPALSIERLEIIHGEPANSVFISPEHQEDFVSKLKQRCPQMKIEGSIRS